MTAGEGELYSDLIERALRTAARHHREHRRKASDLPYITHPAAVALILQRAGFDDDLLVAAALLHDTLEDTAYTRDELQREFPPEVVRCVDALTERKTDSSGSKRSWHERKREHLEQVPHLSIEACAVLLADKLHNLSAMLYDLRRGKELWSRFGAPPAEILAYHREMAERACRDDPRLQRLAEQCTRKIDELAQASERR